MTVNPPAERSFGIGVGGACLGVAALMWWRAHHTTSLMLLVAGVLLVGFGLTAPAVLRLPNRLWWRFAQGLGWVNARVLLTLFFAVVITPIGVMMRLLGRNPLQALRADTNWRPYSIRRLDSKHYEHLF